MIGALKPYPEYRESGVPWLGRIPAHWPVLPNRAIFAEIKDKNHADEEMLSVTIARGVIPQKTLLEDSSKKDSSNQNKAAYKLVCPGDLAYNKMRAWQGAIGVSEFRGIISPAYVVERLRDDSYPRYFHWLYRTPHFAKEAERWSYGITSDMWSLRPEHFKMIYSTKPPPEEQEAITRFLKSTGRESERAIGAKKRLIALLNEQKQAIIHRAVTRGLDHNFRLKPSGNSWLGEIPEHWEVRRLKTLSQFVTSGSRGWARYYSDEGPIFLRIGNISTTSIDLKLNRTTHVSPPADAEGERTRVLENDVLLSITAQIGAVGIVPADLGEAYVNQHTALIRLKGRVCRARWIAYCLLSRFGNVQCQLRTNGGTKVGLTLDDVRTLLVLLPPVAEQEMIVAEIDSRTGNLTAAIDRTEREIGLIREYRTRIIANVVTGQFDVREAARWLPGEANEPEGAVQADIEGETEELLEAVDHE